LTATEDLILDHDVKILLMIINRDG